MTELPEHNGWKNEATWRVAMWLMNTEADYFAVLGMDAEDLRGYVKAMAPESGLISELVSRALIDVDWEQIEAALRE